MTFLKKILLVDYEPRVTALVRKALESTGKYVIKEESDSRRAMNAARWFQPDLILFDVIMSRQDGTAVARELQADASFKDTPVVFLSVNTAPEGGVVSGGILGGYSFFANPVCLDEFVRCVAELVSPTATKPKKLRVATDALAP
jgi:CheY-like chemotaxis protein